MDSLNQWCTPFPLFVFIRFGNVLLSCLFYLWLLYCSGLRFELFQHKTNPINNWAYFVLGQIFIALPFSLLNFILFIDNWKPLILLAVFVTIWVNDTGAYLIGVTFGKHRMFERISPKKSWEVLQGCSSCFNFRVCFLNVHSTVKFDELVFFLRNNCNFRYIW